MPNLIFENCADLVRSTVQPSSVDPDTPYIGLEHIGQGTLQLTGHARAADADSQKAAFRAGDILFGKLRPYFRKAVIAPFDGICSTDIWVVRPKGKTDRNFLFYWMASQDFVDKATGASDGTRMPRANWEYVSQFELPYMGPDEQKEAGALLRALDEKVELLHQQNETLEAMARAIFKSWFVDFDPVRAKAEGRTPEGMDAATAALFPSTFTDTPLGPIPEGWRYGPLSASIDIISGGTPKTSVPEYWGGDIPWFSVVDAPRAEDVFVLDTEKKITPLGLGKCASILMDEGTTIITARGTVGKLALVGRSMAMNQSCYGIKGCDPDSSFFVYFNIKKTVAELQSKTHGSVFDTITKATFDGVHAHYATPEALSAFEKAAKPLMSRIKLNCELSLNLSSLRDTLLPRLISGKLRLTDATAIVESAA